MGMGRGSGVGHGSMGFMTASPPVGGMGGMGSMGGMGGMGMSVGSAGTRAAGGLAGMDLPVEGEIDETRDVDETTDMEEPDDMLMESSGTPQGMDL